MTKNRFLWAAALSFLLFGLRVFAADATNLPPEVNIVSPPDGAVFPESVDIMILAGTKDADGFVKTVEFFADGNRLGVVTNPPTTLDANVGASGAAGLGSVASAQVLGDVFLDIIPLNPFHFVWRDVPAGHHVLTAVATDNLGASEKSAPVEITALNFTPSSIVTVMATDPTASEGDSNTATFTVHRTGPTNSDLVVNYRLGGTASNGIDYVELPSSVRIPAGNRAADVIVVPMDDNLVEGPETVVLTLGAPPCPDTAMPSKDCYLIGRCDRALAIIRDNDQTNRPPIVRILNPQDGEIFKAGSNSRITATAWDFDGTVRTVEFFEGANSLGVVTNPAPFTIWDDDPTFSPIPWLPLYSLTWSNVPAGDYVLTAVATDDQGADTISGPVKIKAVELHPPTVVTIKATDPDASEPNPLSSSPVLDTATFTVYRTGETDSVLTIYYQTGGTAANGVDYAELPHKVTIPAGASSADILVAPIDDLRVEGDESVILILTPPPCVTIFPPPADCYFVGEPGRASAVIHDNEPAPKNQPPMVRLNSPQDGQTFVGPTEIHIVAYGQDREDGYHLKVQFFEGTNSLGFGTFVPTLCPSPYCPNFALTWSNVPPGEYTLTAVATDSMGASTKSDPVRIKVVEPHQTPVVTIFTKDPIATEQSPLVDAAPDTATFVVHRSGGELDDPLTVSYRISGTASNGVDYDKLSGEVIIPAHLEDAEIVVNPIDDDLVEGTETVLLNLLPGCPPCLFGHPPCEVPQPASGCYIVGFPGDAVAFIRDNERANLRPVVTLFAKDAFAAEPGNVPEIPPDTATFAVQRSGGDFNNPLTVSYRISGTASIGVDYNKLSGEVVIPANSETADIVVAPLGDDVVEETETVVLTLEPPICAAEDPPPAGCYIVGVPDKAAAFIRGTHEQNHGPLVEIVKPHNGDTFPALSDIGIDVKAQDPDGWVPSVEFFANGVKIGEESIDFIVAPPPNQEQMFSLVWSNVTAGRYILTAKGTDSTGGTSTSEPVAILAGDVPPMVPMVSIITTDPFASENVSSNGTNTAMFRVFRTGPTNLDLTVFCSVHGTASNGVDYVEIGDSVTIPAGRHSAKVVIVPIKDTLEEGIETVVLRLDPDPTLGPVARYEVGRPDRAAAIIVDNDLHQSPCLRLPDGSFHLCVDKPDGFAFRLEASDDLSAWVSLCTNAVTDGALHFVDPEASEHSHRFYRIVPQSNYVPEE